MKILLAHPPLDDPTLPYHSTAYLAGHLTHCGFSDVEIRDLNIEFVNWCFEPEVATAFMEELGRRHNRLKSQAALSFREQDEFYAQWACGSVSPESLKQAQRSMREKEVFLDFDAYRSGLNSLTRYFCCLGALSYPAEIIHFHQVSRGRFSPYNLRDLFDADLGARICGPFLRFLEERLSADATIRTADVLGISIVYDHQLFHALLLARWFRSRWPEKKILLGGTAISQLYKYLGDKQEMRRFFVLCNGIVAGEGETAICEIADSPTSLDPGSTVRNLITYDAARDRLTLPPQVHYENVPTLGRPLYRYPWELYLSPERGINYSPTRGCYWNRCTFCDYGLNTAKPTSPWRERRLSQVISDLAAAVDENHTRYVYFAVDVMSPSYLERLSDALCDAKLDIRWSAELRMEKVFTPERCRKMLESGCVCVSFGMESGSQRVLDLIDKGTKVEYMGVTMKNFATAGIAVQLMAFSDFPTETKREKAETLEFIQRHDNYWSAGGLGRFLLTGTAIVAQDPSRFGIETLAIQDAEVGRALEYRVLDGGEHESMLTEEADASFDSDGGAFDPVLGRPWAGGTDTLHTMIYYDRFGRSFFRNHPVAPTRSRGPQDLAGFLASSLVIPGTLRESFFDLGRIIASRRKLMDELGVLRRIPREPTLGWFMGWAEGMEKLTRNTDGPTHWIVAGERCLQLDRLIFNLLTFGAIHRLRLEKLLGALNQDLRTKVVTYLRELGALGLIEIRPPEDAMEGPNGSAIAITLTPEPFSRAVSPLSTS